MTTIDHNIDEALHVVRNRVATAHSELQRVAAILEHLNASSAYEVPESVIKEYAAAREALISAASSVRTIVTFRDI